MAREAAPFLFSPAFVSAFTMVVSRSMLIGAGGGRGRVFSHSFHRGPQTERRLRKRAKRANGKVGTIAQQKKRGSTAMASKRLWLRLAGSHELSLVTSPFFLLLGAPPPI